MPRSKFLAFRNFKTYLNGRVLRVDEGIACLAKTPILKRINKLIIPGEGVIFMTVIMLICASIYKNVESDYYFSKTHLSPPAGLHTQYELAEEETGVGGRTYSVYVWRQGQGRQTTNHYSIILYK
jgi:hypothetical protein